MSRFKQHPMIPIFLVVFFGYVGFSLAFPIFSPMFLDTSHNFFTTNLPMKLRTTLLGFVLAAYPLGQFLGLPLLGQLSDCYGRKKVLSISLIFSIFAYMASAASILMHSFWLLILSRFVCGYAEGNFSIAQATVADISTGHHRVKKFGIINMAASLGFVFGPIIGGKLADPQLVSWFGDDTPFWFAGVLILCTWILVLWQLPETKPVEARSKPKDSLHPLSGLMIVHKNFTKTGHRDLYLINFLFYFGLFFFYQYYPVLLVKRYSFTPSGIADISAYVAVIVALSQLLIVHPLAKRVHPRKAAILGAFILAPALGCLTIPNFAIVTYIFLPIACIAMGLATTNWQSLVAHSVSEDLIGEVLGVNYSMQILGEIITSALGGFLAGFFIISLPLVVGGVVVFLAAMAIWIFTQEGEEKEEDSPS